MFEKVGVPVLGVIENMSTHICPQCGHEEHIFGTGGGELMASQYDIDLLGTLALELAIRLHSDAGQPIVVQEPTGRSAKEFRAIARRTGAKLSMQPKKLLSFFSHDHRAKDLIFLPKKPGIPDRRLR